MKAITSTVAAVILLLVVISLAYFGYNFISNYYSTMVSHTIQLKHTLCQDNTASMFITNAGTEEITISECTGSGTTYTCGDLTITKSGAAGGVYYGEGAYGEGDYSGGGGLLLSVNEGTFSPGKMITIKDENCQDRICEYRIISKSIGISAQVRC